jgi:uncharacterized protein YlaN (UPF0358 family)
MKGYYRTLLKTGDDSDFRIITTNEKNEDVERKVHNLVMKQCPYFKSVVLCYSYGILRDTTLSKNSNFEFFRYLAALK